MPSADLCDRHHHPDEPAGYTAWFAWAARMGKTHVQKRCPGCGRFRWWVPKEEASKA